MTKAIGTPKVLKIGHGGDFHFFQNKRHQEHEVLTDALCDLIVREKIDLFYFGGDINDSKTKLSPEQVQAIKRLVKKVTDLVPTVWILGNHDLNLKSKNRLDSLTPFLEDFEPKYPIHFFKHSGIYNLYGINWAVWSCLDDQKSPFTVNKEDIKPGPIIGCFHGAIAGAIGDNDIYKLKAEITVDDFAECDVVFLNDIHKRQSFRNNEIQYSGSWCQTKINEEESKGILIWNWNEKKEKFVADYRELPKNFGYRTYEVKDLKTFEFPKDDLPRTYIPRLLYTGDVNDFSPSLFEGFKKQLQAKVDSEIILQVKPFNSKQVIETEKKGKITDFFKHYFEGLKLTEEQIEELKLIDSAYNKLIDLSDYEIGQYEIQEVTTHNFLSYGPNNVVRWEDIPGIIGLFAPNRTGKSTLLDAVIFCFFNRTSRIAKPDKGLINDQINEEAYVEVKVLINGAKWRIKRTIIPGKKDSISINLEVYEVVDGVEQARHKESRIHTEPMLRKMFGDAEIFLITSLCTQKKPVEFIDCTNAERLDLFLRFLGITAYEQKHELGKKDKDEKENEYKALQKEFETFESKEKIESDILEHEANTRVGGKVVEENEKEIKIKDKRIKELREFVEALQIVEIKETEEELKQNLTKQNELITKKEGETTARKTELKTAKETWQQKSKSVSANDWAEDSKKEKPVETKLNNLRETLGGYILKESQKTIEEWKIEDGKFATEIKELNTKKDVFEKEIEESLKKWTNEESIDQWETDPIGDSVLNKKVVSAELQIQHLQAQLDSDLCPTCKQVWKRDIALDKDSIRSDIKAQEKIIVDSKKTLAKNLELASLQKVLNKQRLAKTTLLNSISEKEREVIFISGEVKALENNKQILEKKKVTEQDIIREEKELEMLKAERSELAALQKTINNTDSVIQLLNTEIALARSKVEEIERNIKLFETNKTNKEKRDKHKTEIIQIEENITILRTAKQIEEAEITNLKQKIKVCEDSLKAREEKQKKVLAKETECKNYEYYVKAMHRSGISFLILQTYIPDINFEINDNLQGLFDFSVFFELSDKNLDIYFADNTIKQNKRNVAQTSGLEGFAINLAIRAALTRISLLPKPSIFMIDEGFAVADGDNLELLKELLCKFRNQYHNIVIITHLDDLKDFPEHYIKLEKKNGITSIC